MTDIITYCVGGVLLVFYAGRIMRDVYETPGATATQVRVSEVLITSALALYAAGLSWTTSSLVWPS